MKKEDIDKKIGMPDVDAEWARFEHEVIDKKTKAGKNLWLWGLSIAASIIIVAGFFLPHYDFKEQEQLLAEQEVPLAPEMIVEEPVDTTNIVEKQIIEPRTRLTQTEVLRSPKTQNKGTEQDWNKEVNKSLQEQIACLGTSPNEPELKGVIAGLEAINPNYNDSILVLLNGERLPDSLCTRYFVRRGIHPYLAKQGLLVDDIVRLNEDNVTLQGDDQMKQRYSEYVERYGELARHGVAEITSANDSANEVFILQHPELMKTFRRVEGFVVEEVTNEPLESTIVHYRSYVTTADSIGHFVLWVPKSADTLYAKCIGCREALFQPADTTITIRLHDNVKKEDLFKKVNQPLQEQIANLTIVPTSAGLGSGNTLRLIGTGDRPSDKDRIDSTLILVNGEPLPDSLKWQVLGESPDDMDTYIYRYFYRQHQMLDLMYVHKDSEFTEQYGGRAKYGVIELKTVPDMLCDDYVKAHPKMKKKYHRIEGYVVNNEGKPLTEAWVHIKRELATLKKHPELDLAGAATDSTGHYVLWLPNDTEVTLCAKQSGYKSVEFSPSDKTLVIHLEPGTSMRLRGTQSR